MLIMGGIVNDVDEAGVDVDEVDDVDDAVDRGRLKPQKKQEQKLNNSLKNTYNNLN